MSISQKYPEAWDFYNDRPGKENPMSNKDMTSLRSSQGNLPSERPQRAEYQAEWTFAEALSEYADSLESERDRLRERVAELEEACQAALAYDAAIQASANDPQKMSSFCTAEGDDLDSLYAAWIDKARAVLAKVRP